uniref:Uncharacterized protein n=1 Tax=Ditylenchus dipsaci TaxID=166011 RepID=A0A915EHK2_9BILA
MSDSSGIELMTDSKLRPRSKESVAYHLDPFNRPELTHTLRGRELVCFVIFIVIIVIVIILVFERVMPVLYIFQARPTIPARFLNKTTADSL